MGNVPNSMSRCDGDDGSQAKGCPVNHGEAAKAGSCPVDHSGKSANTIPGLADMMRSGAGQCPYHDKGKGSTDQAVASASSLPAGHPTLPYRGTASQEHASQPSAQPKAENPAAKGKVYNVYSYEINPDNMMPKGLDTQKPAPGQDAPLSTERVRSSIPKGGTEKETWTYPSPQMFYNALVRKNKAHDVTASDMDVVVAIHNGMNELTWKRLLDWEKLHGAEHKPGCPKLRRFRGRPYDLSIKAKLKSMLGWGFPFDRHDWYVDRGDGKEVRYIIDYYSVDEGQPNPNAGADGTGGLDSIWVDVRPAVDSPSAAMDRIARFPERMLEALRRPAFVFRSSGIDPSQVPAEVKAALDQGGETHGADKAEQATRAAEQAAPSADVTRRAAEAAAAAKKQLTEAQRAAAARLEGLDKRCSVIKKRLASASTEEERATAHLALMMCSGQVVCPSYASAFETEFKKNADLSDRLGAGASASAELREGREREREQFDELQACVVARVTQDTEALQEVGLVLGGGSYGASAGQEVEGGRY